MVDSISKLRMAIDPFKVLDSISDLLSANIRQKEIVSVSYDPEADVMYVRFDLSSDAVDNEPIDELGYILLALNSKEEIIGITIMNAKRFIKE
ncbi:MAG: DUF2283 domain-containing protein [Promethearchaeota archaeon]